MEPIYRREFVVSKPREVVWRALTEPAELAAWHGHAERFEVRAGGRIRFVNPGWADVDGMMVEVVPNTLIHWRTTPQETHVKIQIRQGERGTSISITHLAPLDEWRSAIPSIQLGWDESIADLALLLEHDVRMPRHMSRRCSLGATTRETLAGVEVVTVERGGMAASAGLQAGDLIVQMAGAPIFHRSDIALLLREHASRKRWTFVIARDGSLIDLTCCGGPRRSGRASS